MKNSQDEIDNFDEKKSLQLINEMLLVSKRKLKYDGILMIVWGWVMTIHYLVLFVLENTNPTFLVKRSLKYLIIGLVLLALAYTIYYIINQRTRVQTYVGIALRYVWISMFMSMVFINLIQMNVLHAVNFELQHPIFMVIIAFATVVSGGILRFNMLIFGGICFAILALIASYFPLPLQFLMEGVAWLLAFVIPGHLIYAKRNS